jgi:2-keto-3-deoxy-L-rhamnonate aldolase RhmA
MAGMSRASRFGSNAAYLAQADRLMGVIVQLETPEALSRIDEIAAVDGIDGLFIGPADLSAHMGHPGQLHHPKVLDAMGRAARRCRELGRPMGTIGNTPAEVTQYRAAGFSYLAVGSDLGLLMRGAADAIGALRTQGAETHVHSLATGTATGEGAH